VYWQPAEMVNMPNCGFCLNKARALVKYRPT
jgi:hypothetical protein